MAYARVYPPNIQYSVCSISRVVVKKEERKKGFGKKLMNTAIELIQQHYPSMKICISAHLDLQGFYEKFGFKPVGLPYIEDGISLIQMIK